MRRSTLAAALAVAAVALGAPAPAGASSGPKKPGKCSVSEVGEAAGGAGALFFVAIAGAALARRGSDPRDRGCAGGRTRLDRRRSR